jgi:flagellar motor switch protein FliM
VKTERAFVAERVAAVHCPELLQSSGRAPVDLAPRLSALAERLARALAPRLGAFAFGEIPKVSATAASACDFATLSTAVGPLAGNSLFAMRDAVPLLAAFDAGAVLAYMDRAFGGSGEVPAPLPEKFPLSVELMLGRVEAALSAALAEAFDLADDGEAIRAIDRNGSLSTLAPFPRGAGLVRFTLEVSEEGRGPWPIHFAIAEAMLPVLLGEATAASPTRAIRPEAEPFASLPLELSAVLVDMAMSMATLAAIEPGQVIPVAVARSVPIKLGGRKIAAGQVGAADDCVAIRITQTF